MIGMPQLAAEAKFRRLAHVVQGPDHAGKVEHRWTLKPATAEGTGGLTLEVDDDEVFAGPKDLSEVVVAMAADALCLGCKGPEPAQPAQYLVLPGERFFKVARAESERSHLSEDLASQAACSVVEGLPVERGQGLGSEFGVSPI